MDEIWKDIDDYEGLYQVSNLGNVRSFDRYVVGKDGVPRLHKSKMLHIQHNERVNVYEVHLYKDGKRKCHKVHRLVASAFVENDDVKNKTSINHKDGNRANNNADNLEWATYSYNLKHAYDELKRPINAAKVKRRKCTSINKHTGLDTSYDSIEAASRGTGISCTQIRRIALKECDNVDFDFVIYGIND